MNGTELKNALRRLEIKYQQQQQQQNKNLLRNCGVHPANMLPKCGQILNQGSFMIVNTDPVQSEGTHWLALYCPIENGGDVIEVFDSYGFKLETYPIVKQFLVDRCHPLLVKTIEGVPVQDEKSDTCGPHCIFYLAKRILENRSMHEVVTECYGGCQLLNDCLVLHYLFDHIML